MRFALRLGIPFHSTLLAIAIPALAQTNYWLKPGDGFWHEPHWSLNVLPASNQTAVEFSSHGSKRLVISSTAAARSYRASLRVREIVLSARDRELNTLLLDNVGLSSPLQCSIFNLGVNS